MLEDNSGGRTVRSVIFYPLADPTDAVGDGIGGATAQVDRHHMVRAERRTRAWRTHHQVAKHERPRGKDSACGTSWVRFRTWEALRPSLASGSGRGPCGPASPLGPTGPGGPDVPAPPPAPCTAATEPVRAAITRRWASDEGSDCDRERDLRTKNRGRHVTERTGSATKRAVSCGGGLSCGVSRPGAGGVAAGVDLRGRGRYGRSSERRPPR